MSLIKVNELLQHATEHHYGVPAINVINTETIRYAIQAAEDEHMPIIIQYWPGFEDHCALDIIAFAARYYAERERARRRPPGSLRWLRDRRQGRQGRFPLRHGRRLLASL